MDSDTHARAAWSRLAEPGDKKAQAFVAERGPVPALRAVLAGDPVAQRWRARLPDLDPARDLDTLARFRGRLLVPADEEWPPGLADLGVGAPFCLWVRGNLRLVDAVRRSAAIVGSRAATHYGEHVAGELAAGCTERGITVVSGAAYGIDACAHRGALAVGGPSVAALACGVDRGYPRGNEPLISRLAHEGAVVSEVPPGSAPTRWRFLQRNRLIAAITGVTVVVEAAWRSGALNTAWWAECLGRPLAAVPGPVTSPASTGCHRLIRDHGAVCVTRAQEVAELAAAMGEELPMPPSVPAADHDGLGQLDLRVLDALPVRAGVLVESLVRCAGVPPGQVMAALGRLETAGLAVRADGGWRRPARRA